MDASDHIAAARDTLLKQIVAYCAYMEISEAAFGRRAAGTAHFVPNLRSGRSTVKLMDRAQAFLRAERAKLDTAA